MTSAVAFFPGQGSQIVGMGRDFFEQHQLAKDLFAEADSTLGFSLSKLCFDGPLDELTLTQHAQPAILTVSVIAFSLLEQQPLAAAGHSLGEYSALVCAGAISFKDAVLLVHKRGRYMQEAVPSGTGKMIAVLGPSVEEIESTLSGIPGLHEVANINCPGQTVVSGDVSGIDAAAEALSSSGAKVIPLNVSAPFHCSLMKPAADNLSRDIAALSVSIPRFPVYSNVTAKPHTTAEEIKNLLIQQVCAPVRWTPSVESMLADTGATQAVEFGAGGVLSNLLKRINKSIARLDVSDGASLDKTRAVFAVN